MERMTRQFAPGGGGVALRWLVVVLLAGGVGALLAEVAGGQTPPEVETQARTGAEVVAVTGQLGSGAYGIYLLDTRRRTICLYQWDASRKVLRLLASRTWAFDAQLDEYNTHPSPREIKRLIGQRTRLTDVPAEP
jgi:hypothetical protein